MAYIDKADVITVMTVDPGFAGQSFIPESLNKITALKEYKEKNKSEFTIQIDGSCNRESYEELRKAGSERLVLGSSGLFNLSDDINKAISIMEFEIQNFFNKSFEKY